LTTTFWPFSVLVSVIDALRLTGMQQVGQAMIAVTTSNSAQVRPALLKMDCNHRLAP
jgi:hypothetical protein